LVATFSNCSTQSNYQWCGKGLQGCHKKNIAFDCMNDRKVEEDKNSPVCGDVPLCANNSSVETEVDLEVDPFQQK